MAYIVPDNPIFENEAEQRCYEYFQTLPDEYVLYFHHHAGQRVLDMALIVPDRGILIIEIKGWHYGQILSVQDQNCVLYQLADQVQPLPSPLNQANTYRFNVINRVKAETGKDFVVLPIVCYPFLTAEEFQEKRLDLLSPRQLTLLSGDLGSLQALEDKISSIFSAFGMAGDPFDWEGMKTFRLLFETEEGISRHRRMLKVQYIQTAADKRPYYSHLTFIPSQTGEEETSQIVRDLIDLWIRGTKIFLLSDDSELIDKAQKELETALEEHHLNKHFPFRDREKNYLMRIFNFDFYRVESRLSDISFTIIDGAPEDIECYKAFLRQAHDESPFNFQQYQIEHAPVDNNIMVRAGAGSGKTFSMISRINFLIYKHELDPNALKSAIILITFTNEAADNMKARLQKHFQDYFILTKDYHAFQYIEKLEEVKICTIHSLVKQILQAYAPKMGLGEGLSIVSAKYERSQMLAQFLDQYLQERIQDNPDIMSELGLSMNKLLSLLQGLMKKMENMNIDVLEDHFNFGGISQYPELTPLIDEVIKRVEHSLREQMNAQNSVRLSDLIIKLKSLVKQISPEELNSSVQYLFVDEFQDTDDVQIDLMRRFQQLIGFKFFIVGDIKQCIYRFRGAEQEAFVRLLKDKPRIKDEEADLEKLIKTWGLGFTLNKNYRSDRLLLSRYEKIFKYLGSGQEPYLPYHPIDDRLTSHISLNRPDDAYFKAVEVNDPFREDQDFRTKFVQELKNQYEQLPAGETIAILVRENWEADYIRKITGKHIFIELQGGGTLYQSEAALDLYKLVLALQNSRSPRHLYNLYTTGYTGKPLPAGEIYLNRNQVDQLVARFLADPPLAKWEQYLADLKMEPVLHVLRQVILDTQPWIHYADRKQPLDEDQKEQFVRSYRQDLDLVFEQLLSVNNTDYLTVNKIEDFLKIKIVTKQKQEKHEMKTSADTVRKSVVCLTVHKAKGLEYHTVMLPFPHRDLEDEKRGGSVELVAYDSKIGFTFRKEAGEAHIENDHFFHQKDYEKKCRVDEEARILYVAMTRAKRNFVYFYKPNFKKPKSWQSFIRKAGEQS